MMTKQKQDPSSLRIEELKKRNKRNIKMEKNIEKSYVVPQNPFANV